MKGARSDNPRNKSQKFYFDKNIFDPAEEEDEAPAEPPPPVFSEAELDAVRQKTYQEAYSKGRHDAMDEALSSREHLIAQVLQAIAQSWGDILQAEAMREAVFEREAVNLSTAIFEKLFPIYAARSGFGELTAIITDIIKKQEQQSKITINTDPDAAAGITEHIKTLNTQMGGALEGRYEVVPLDSLAQNAIRLSWKDGGAIRDIDAMATTIREILHDTLAGAEPTSHDGNSVSSITSLTDNDNGDQP